MPLQGNSLSEGIDKPLSRILPEVVLHHEPRQHSPTSCEDGDWSSGLAGVIARDEHGVVQEIDVGHISLAEVEAIDLTDLSRCSEDELIVDQATRLLLLLGSLCSLAEVDGLHGGLRPCKGTEVDAVSLSGDPITEGQV